MVREIAPDTYRIDCLFGDLPEQCCVYLLRGERNALVDTGPSVCLPHLLAGFAEVGFDVAALDLILLTHFHMDHAGGAAALLEMAPGARALVDPGSIGYLLSPERLVRSARKSLGRVASFYGTMEPLDPGRLSPLSDGMAIDLGERSLLAVHTPGHCNGHYVFLESESGSLFCGDALGHFIERASFIYPATPAPEFDAGVSLASADKMAELEPRQLLFAHYGGTAEAAATLRHFREQLAWFLAAAREMAEPNSVALAARLLADFPPMPERELDLVRGILEVNCGGVLHYLSKL